MSLASVALTALAMEEVKRYFSSKINVRIPELRVNSSLADKVPNRETDGRHCLQESVPLVAVLKTCARKKDLERGVVVHADILARGLLGKNPFVASSLVSMYAKCGVFMKAREVLEELPVRDIFAWSALIVGYVHAEYGKEALNCYDQMVYEGLSPDAVTFACSLKACGSVGALDRGKSIHAEITRLELLEGDSVLGGALVDMYVKCCALPKAKEVLQGLSIRSAVTWSTLIAGYAQSEHGKEALECFEQMQSESLSADAVTFACVLKACGSVGALERGESIHFDIVRQRLLEENTVLGSALVDMYVKCGALVKGKEVLEGLPTRDMVTWSALIAGYAQGGCAEDAIGCFEQMHCEGFAPNEVTFTCILKCCGSIGALDKGRKIHCDIVRQGLLLRNAVLGCALVDMYAKCGAVAEAEEVLEGLDVRDAAAWSALIAGYAQSEHGERALNCFQQMLCEGLSPDAVTFACILKMCGSIGALDIGKQLHSEVVSHRLLGGNVVLGNALVDLYAKCGALLNAKEVLEELSMWDVVTWNSLIAGCTHGGSDLEALNCFHWMQHEGVHADAVTFISILKACSFSRNLKQGQSIHCEIVRQGLLQRDVVVSGALVDMYAKCGALTKAKEVLEELAIWNVVMWNALIAGCVQEEDGKEALNSFERMQREGLSPDAITCVCVLKACGSIGAIGVGECIHFEIVRQALLGDIAIGGALVDMYCKCGVPVKAKEVLEGLPVHSVMAWNALIAGYAQEAHGKDAIYCFECMQVEGIYPDNITFLCVLTACSKSGLLIKGQQYLAKLSTEYGNLPNLEQYSCMVYLLGCLGLLDDAVAILKIMPYLNHLSIWLPLLTVCVKWGNVKLGRWAFQHAVQLDAKAATSYVLMGNIHVAVGMEEEAKKVEVLRVKSAACV